MSATVTKRKSFTRDELVEAIAALDAALMVIDNQLSMNCDSLAMIITRLHDELVPSPMMTGDEEAWHRDPTTVEIHARAAEIEAEILTEYADEIGRTARWEVDERVALCQLMATRYRESGTADLHWETDDAGGSSPPTGPALR